MKLAFLLFPMILSAQRITYSTDATQNIDATAWQVSACSESGAPTVIIPVGLLFQHLALHGAHPLTNTEAMAVFSQAPSRSIAGRLVEYSGWAAVGAGVLMTTNQIKVSEQVKVAVSMAGAFVSVLVPLVRQKIPPVSPLRDSLIGNWLTVPAGGCSQGVILGGPGVDFEVTL